MIKISIAIAIFSLLILYFMFGHTNNKKRRHIYYLPLCVVSTGFLFITLHSVPAIAGKPPSCNEVDVSNMVSSHIDTINFVPQSLKFSDSIEYIEQGEKRCKLNLSLQVIGEPVEKLLINYHYSIDKDKEGKYSPAIKFIDVKAYRLSH